MLRKIKTKGVILGSYMVMYGVARALIEGIRGESLMIGSTGIRVSQLLSVILVLAGIIVIIWRVLAKRKTKEAKL